MPSILTPISAYTGYDSLDIEFSTDEISTSTFSFSYTDHLGIARTGSSARTGYTLDHIYSLRNLPRNTTITYTVTATFLDGTTDTVGPDTIDTKSPVMYANIRTDDVTVPGTEISLMDVAPKLFTNPRLFYVQLTVSANTLVRFEEGQETQTLIPNQVYHFYVVGDMYLTGPSVVSLAFMRNPNY